MKPLTFTIVKAGWKRQKAGNQLNPGRVILFKFHNRRYVAPISAGDSDSVYAWRDGKEIIVLSMNERLGYVGIETFTVEGTTFSDYSPGRYEANHVDDHFLQSDEEVRETLGPRGLELSPSTIVRRLMSVAY